MAELRNRIAMMPPGTKVRLQVLRDGKEKTFTVKLGQQDDEQIAAQTSSKMGERLGLRVQTLTGDLAAQLNYEGAKGVVISGIQPGSVAERAGLRRGDLVLEVNRKPVEDEEDYEKALEGAADKRAVLLLVRREEHTQFIALRLSE